MAKKYHLRLAHLLYDNAWLILSLNFYFEFSNMKSQRVIPFSCTSLSHIHWFLCRVVCVKCKVMLDGGPSLQKHAIRNLAMLLLVVLINFCRRMYKLCLSVSFTASSIWSVIHCDNIYLHVLLLKCRILNFSILTKRGRANKNTKNSPKRFLFRTRSLSIREIVTPLIVCGVAVRCQFTSSKASTKLSCNNRGKERIFEPNLPKATIMLIYYRKINNVWILPIKYSLLDFDAIAFARN